MPLFWLIIVKTMLSVLWPEGRAVGLVEQPWIVIGYTDRRQGHFGARACSGVDKNSDHGGQERPTQRTTEGPVDLINQRRSEQRTGARSFNYKLNRLKPLEGYGRGCYLKPLDGPKKPLLLGHS